MLKRLSIIIALAGVSGGAAAADLRGPIIEAPPPLPVPAFSWTGGYVGVNVGLGAASNAYGYQVDTPGSETPGYYTDGYYTDGYTVDGYYTDGYYTPGTSTPATSSRGSERSHHGGVLGGVQVGYNYAFGGFGGLGGFGGFGGHGLAALPVIGVEADFDGSGIGSASTLGAFASGFPYGNPAYVGVGTDFKYFGTVRGRLGVAFDRLLVYGTGGFAYAQTDNHVDSPTYAVSTRSNNFHTGIAYGGGVEFALTNNLLLRAEYLHYDFNKKTIAHGEIGCGCYSHSYSLTDKPSLDVVRAGLDYKFDFARAVVPPVIARY